MDYIKRYYHVLKHIDSNLEDDLCVEFLSDLANLSKFHFHRQFSSLFGIGVSAYIKQLRMKKASFQLAFREEIKIIDIALMNGYESPEAFSRAFREFQGQSPRQFRSKPNWISWHENSRPLNEIRSKYMIPRNRDNSVKLIQFPKTRIAAIEHRGNPSLLMNTVKKFITWRRENKLSPKISRTFNLLYDDPREVEAELYRMDICCSITDDIKGNQYGVYSSFIPEGRCAVLRHSGDDANIEKTVSYLYREWLSNSGEELRDFPIFFERVLFYPDVAEHEAITDVYLPLK